MNIKRNINFFLEKRKKGGDVVTENVPIIMRVTWCGLKADFSTGYRIDVKKWDPAAQRVKKGSTNKKKESASDINDYLSGMEKTLKDVFKHYELEEVVPTVGQVRQSFNERIVGNYIKPDEKNIIRFREAWKEFTTENGRLHDWTHATYQKFNTALNHITDFKKGISFEDFTENGLNSYVSFLRSLPMPDGSIGMKNSTIEKQLSFLRWFLNWATKKGYNTLLDYQIYHPALKVAGNEPLYLTKDEIHKLMAFNAPEHMENLNVARDIFIFQCFTSLRYSDVQNLKKVNVFDDHIVLTIKKTHKTVSIELNKYSKAILDKYKDLELPDGAALPTISNQKMNKALKKLFELAGIDTPVTRTYYKGQQRIDETKPKYELISTHTGRRTFVVIGLSSGIDPYTITQWTGHASLSAMKPYMAVVDKHRQESMKKFDEI